MQAFYYFKSHRWLVLAMGLALGLFTFTACAPEEQLADEATAEATIKLEPVSVLFVDSENVASEIKRQWLARRDGELSFEEISSEQFLQDIDGAIKQHDAIVYPCPMLGELATNGSILEIPKSVWKENEFSKRLLRNSRTINVGYKKRKWAMPLGNPHLCLMYRSDVLQALKARPPESWAEFFAIAETLRNTEELKDGNGNPLPLEVDMPASEGWAATSLFAVAAARVRNRGKLATVFERESVRPLINEAPFVDALNQVKSVFSSHPQQRSPAEIAVRMFGGETAMAIGWPSATFFETDSEDPNENVQIISLPGASRWYDFEKKQWNDREEALAVDLLGFSGRNISVLTSTDNPNNAFEFSSWLSEKQISLIAMSRFSESGPLHTSHLGDVFRWTGEQVNQDAGDNFADLIAESQDRKVYFLFPRIPGNSNYIRSLDDAVRQCLNCLLYTSPSPRDQRGSRMPSSA